MAGEAPQSRDMPAPLITRTDFERQQALRQILLLARAMVAQLESMLGDEPNESEEESR